jgi:hypothetical protein
MLARTARQTLTVLLLACAGALAARAAGTAQLLCRFQDPEIAESSGLAAASASGEYFFTHNDSGDRARIFAVDRQGRTLATFKVPGATNHDWEDMARARDAEGRPTLLIGDIGDNGKKRDHVIIYEVPEPPVDVSRAGVHAETEPARRYEVRYPDGPHDAETLLFNPVSGQVFLVTKDLKSSGVYASRGRLKADEPNVLTKVSWIRFVSLPATTKSLADYLRRLLATGGDISPDGTRVVIRTYTDAYEWTIHRGDVAAAVRTEPTHYPLPVTVQGEAAAYTTDGAAILFSSEKAGAPVHELKR